MAKLYFKYGAMGCSKSAQALMCRFNYIQKGYKVLLIKPSLDTRDNEDGVAYVKSRIGLKAKCLTFSTEESLMDLYLSKKDECDVVIVDECQFATTKQINDLRDIAEFVPVICYGLKTNFKTELFEGSKRLIEIADNINEIKSVCSCGANATVNARIVDGILVTSGDEIQIGSSISGFSNTGSNIGIYNSIHCKEYYSFTSLEEITKEVIQERIDEKIIKEEKRIINGHEWVLFYSKLDATTTIIRMYTVKHSDVYYVQAYYSPEDEKQIFKILDSIMIPEG